MASRQVSVDLPEDLWKLVGDDVQALSARMRQALVLDLVREKEISAGFGARLLDMHLTDFVRLMARQGISYFTGPPQDPEELDRSLARRET